MRDQHEPIETLLLDWHLGRLNEDDARRVEQALAESPGLAAQSGALGRVLHLLDRDEAVTAPADLAETVMHRINTQTGVIPMPSPSPKMGKPVYTGQEFSGSAVLSLRELVAIAACIVVFVGIFVPGYRKAQNVAQRNLCRNNSQQIWMAMANYAEANSGYLPHSGYVPGASFLPSKAPNVQRVSNAQPMFTVLKQGYIRDNDARVFVCPSAPRARPMLAEDYRQFNDFAEPDNVTYSFQFMNTPRGRRMESMHIGMVLMADRNPLFDPRVLGYNLNPYEQVNSLLHEQGAGQNVVYLNGAGVWSSQPTVGVNQDNIYRAGSRTYYQGTECPTSETDTWLVP